MSTKDKKEMMGEGLLKDDLRPLIADFLLSTSEHFIQLHGGRGSGKTYTTQKTLISYCLLNQKEFLLTVPTQNLKENGALKKWTAKVLGREFKGWQHKTTFDYLYMRRGEEEDWQRVGQCMALSKAEDDKINSDVYQVDFMIWDESMRINMTPGTADMLIELFLFAYHTVDRDENRVKAIFLGNALNKLDPLYQFFGVTIQDLKKPGIVKRSFNKASWYVPVPPDVEGDDSNVFRKTVEGTRYGDAAAGKFDMSYGFLVGDPGDQIVTTCYGIEFLSDGYLLIMMSEGCMYIQECNQAFAKKYAQRLFTVRFKNATVDIPTIPPSLISAIRNALAAGRCKFVDEESLLTACSRLETCYNIKILG